MTAPIEFWFDVISPYAWFAARRIEALAARHGRTVRWRPMLLGVSVMKVMGLRPLMDTPLKGDYVARDLQRTARREGLVLQRDLRAAPMSPLPAARAIAWLDAQARAQAGPVARAVMDGYWLEGAAMDDAARLRPVLAGAGLAPAQIEAALAPEPGSALLRESVAAGLAAGVFGSPTVLIDGEPFWGHDRLDEAERWLATGGW